jgi:hypothetical protein
MRIEILIDKNEQIFLTPVSSSNKGKEKNYQLIDDSGYVWIEVALVNNSFDIIRKDSRISEPIEDLRSKLDNLVLEVIEAEQSGTDNTEDKTEDISPYDPDKIKVHSKQFSIKLIQEMIENGDIDFSPDFQRNFVWDSIQKSRLIESILLRIPLPMFYFSEDEEGKISVVDGLQRLTTIREFMDNKFPLRKLEYLKDSCEGCYYSSKDGSGKPNGKKAIDPKYFRWFNMTQFSVNVIDPTSPSKVKYDIFRRINTGGKPLNGQEIRNCLSGKGLRETLKKMVSLQEFKEATDYSIKSTRMADEEIALRFILFHELLNQKEGINAYNGYMDSSLDDLTESLVKYSADDLSTYVMLFSNAMKNAHYLFGGRYAFRKVTPAHLNPVVYKQLINRALFVSCSVLLAKYEYQKVEKLNEPQSLLNPLAQEIEDDDILMGFLTYGTNSKANLVYVFDAVQDLLKDNLKY